jgi:DNA polymerase III subunit delta'
MAFKDHPNQKQGIALLQRSLERKRLAHGYLFTGPHLDVLEAMAANLAKTLNCLEPVRCSGVPVDCCEHCLNCRKIGHGNHGDVHWVRPESKSRIITIDQMRDVMQQINLKPNEAEYKVAVVVAADRLNTQAANAFLKTLEEPPSKSILILLTTDSQRLIDTILSRCLRLNFGGEGRRQLDPVQLAWLNSFSATAAAGQKSLIGRYRLLDQLLQRLTDLRGATEEALRARSPLEQHKDAEKDLRDKWEAELSASMEAD